LKRIALILTLSLAALALAGGCFDKAATQNEIPPRESYTQEQLKDAGVDPSKGQQSERAVEGAP
jgi:hypothetical protein